MPARVIWGLDMTWESANVIVQVVAAIAVIISLWYLAVQLRQNTELARAELEVQLGVIWAEMHDNMIQNPSLAKAYDLAEKNWEELSEEDARAYLWFVAKSFHVLEGMFRQKQRGLMTDEVWAPYEQYIVGVLQIEAVSGWWHSEGSLTSKEFKDHVETLLHSPEDSSWRQVSTAEMIPAKKQG
jgi:hypothetical protein